MHIQGEHEKYIHFFNIENNNKLVCLMIKKISWNQNNSPDSPPHTVLILHRIKKCVSIVKSVTQKETILVQVQKENQGLGQQMHVHFILIYRRALWNCTGLGYKIQSVCTISHHKLKYLLTHNVIFL